MMPCGHSHLDLELTSWIRAHVFVHVCPARGFLGPEAGQLTAAYALQVIHALLRWDARADQSMPYPPYNNILHTAADNASRPALEVLSRDEFGLDRRALNGRGDPPCIVLMRAMRRRFADDELRESVNIEEQLQMMHQFEFDLLQKTRDEVRGWGWLRKVM